MRQRGVARRHALRLVAFSIVLMVGVAPASLLTSIQATRAAPPVCNAQGPGAYPNDPNYSPAENGQAGATWNDEQWYLYSCMPQGAPLTTNPENASGMSVDSAWAQFSKGSDQVVVAYMEGGVNWRIGSSCELKDQAWLNTGELPIPEFANGTTKVSNPYDLNNDGVVNVEDYIQDPRVLAAVSGVQKSPSGGPYLHHVCGAPGGPPGGTDITPEDLIVAFGHCQIDSNHLTVGSTCAGTAHYDNDGNGYANDINGWNFNRDTNDPQTEQSIYGHFNGESGQMVAQADNNYGGAGMCPKCRYIPIKAGDEAIDRPDRVAEAITFAADSGVKVMDATSASLGLTDSVKAAIDYAYHKGMVVVFASNDFESADHTDGMLYPHVWPGNSVTGDHSTRGATPPAPLSNAFYGTNTTFLSRSSLTSFGPHALFSVPTNDGSTSTGTPTNAGVAALVAAEGANAAGANGGQLNADEIKQVVRANSLYIGALPTCPTCFQGIAGATFNIQYGYGRPNVLKADQAVAAGHIPPTADIRSPDWYQPVDPTKQSALHASADLAAPRSPAGAFTYTFQYGLGPQPTEAEFHDFGSGARIGAASVGADLNLNQIPSSFWSGAYAETADRLSIEQYDVTIRVQVHALDRTSTVQMGEDRRAIHVRHDSTERPGFPVKVGSSGEASPTMADIEGRGWLDTIVSTADGTVHAYRPDGSEAPGFPVHTGPAPGVDPASDVNYLRTAAWHGGTIPLPHDGGLSTPAVGDLRHDGGLEIVMSTFSGRTYVWDGAGRLLPGFPVLNGNPSLFHYAVPPPDTPYSFEPENITGGSPVLADLNGDGRLDIIQVAGDNHIYAYQVSAAGVSLVPGWPVCDIFNIDGSGNPSPAGGPTCTEPKPPAGYTHTHDSKIVPTPAIASIDGTGRPNLIVGLVDTTWGPPLGSMKITSYLEAFSSRGTLATPTGQLAGWPVPITGLEQGYGVAQDFVTQGTESPVVYDGATGPQAIVNSNLFDPVRVDLPHCPGPLCVSPPFLALSSEVVPQLTTLGLPPLAIVPFTTSASLGKAVGGTIPLVAQPGSSAGNVVVGITQTPGLGVKVENAMGVWQADTGATTTAANHKIQGLAFFTAPAIADVTGTGLPAIMQPTDSGAVEGFDLATGTAVAGFPKWTGGWSLFTPAVGDLTGSGTVAVAATTREGYLHVWDTPGLTSANHEAWHWHQDDRNTGHYGTDTRPPAGIQDLSIDTSGAKWTLSFSAPGDDWNYGTAAAYDVRCSANPITQDNFGQATPVDLGGVKPAAGGTKESIVITPPAGARYCAVRAIDKAGNIGPVPVASGTSNGGTPAGAIPAASGPGSLPNTSQGATATGALVGLLAGVLLTLGTLASRRRSNRG